MASTYSPTLRIELIGTGEQSGVWGETTNNNLGGLLEQAITGVQLINMNDTDYTLVALNGTVDQARNAVIVMSALSDLTATRAVVIPSVEKTYVFKNSTPGYQSLTIRTSSGTGVTVPTGETVWVYCDGTNVYPAATYFPTISLGAPIPIASGGTGATTAAAARTALSVPSTTGDGASGTWNITSANTNNVAAGGTIDASVTGVTQSGGTSNTTLATTNFVQTAIAGSVSPPFPGGTIMLFANSTAPTTWVQITTDTANNRLLRVVNTTGGGTGGSDSPILNNVLPSHTHTFSTGTESQGHTHSFSASTGGESNGHTHSFSGSFSGNTGITSNDHTHGVSDPGHSHQLPTWGTPGGAALPVQNGNPLSGGLYSYSAGTGISIGGQSTSHYHGFSGSVSGNTGAVSASHTHSLSGTTGNISANHTHSGTTNSTGSGSGWAPRYVDLIMCVKA